MKLSKTKKTISIICSVIGFILSAIGLMAGIDSIDAEGLGGIGVIFIMPSLILLVIILLDFLITVDKIKKGLIYSFIISLVKIGFIVLFIPSTMYDFNYQMEFGTSNLSFDLIVIALIVIIAIPSVFNVIKLSNKKQI